MRLLYALLQVFAIEFVAFAIEFVPFAIEFVGIAIEFVGIAIEFVPFVLVIAWVAVKFGINITSVVLEMGINFTRRSRVKFTISNTTRVVFIPNFTATHAIPS